jgi:hypothetical protein
MYGLLKKTIKKMMRKTTPAITLRYKARGEDKFDLTAERAPVWGFVLLSGAT